MSDINQIRRYINGPKCFKASRYCLGDQVSDESSGIAALAAAAAASGGRVQVVFEPGKYNLTSPRNLFQLFSNLEIIAEGAEFIVGSVSTSGWDLSATDTYTFDNGIFYVTTPTIDNFRFYGGTFTLTPTQLAPLQIGDSGTHTSGPQTNGNWTVEGLEQNGGNTILLLRGDDVTAEVKQKNTHGTGLNVSASTGRVRFYRGSLIGVNSAKSQWNNCSAIVANGCDDMAIMSPRTEYVGGSAIICRASSNALRRLLIVDPGLTACGNAGIGLSVFSGAANNQAMEQVGVRGGYIKGYLCGVDGGTGASDHDGITVAVNKGGSGTAGTGWQPIVDTPMVDFLSPDETFNYSTYDVSGSYNPKKAKGTAIGVTAGIKFQGADAYSPVQGGKCIAPTIRHAKTAGIVFDRVLSGQIIAPDIAWCGYERDGSNLPLTSAHGIFVDNSAETTVRDPHVRNHNPGCSGSGSANTFLVFSKNSYATRVSGGQLRGNGGTAWNNAPVGHQDGAATFAGIDATAFDLTSRTCSTIVDNIGAYGTHFGGQASAGTHVRYISGSAGHVLVLNDAYTSRPTGSATIERGVTLVLMSHASGAANCTLPSAAGSPGQRVTIKHVNAGGTDVSVLVGTGSVIGATTLAAGEFAIYLAEGANWQQVA